MKITVLCILGALCAAHAETGEVLHKLQNAVKVYTRTTEVVKENLEEYEYEYPMNLEMELVEEILSPMSSIEKIVKEAHQEIHALHEKSGDNDDAETCCTSTTTKLYYIGERGNSDLNVCLRYASIYLDPALELMSDTIETADKQLNDLDALMAQCEEQEASVESSLEKDVKEAKENLKALATTVDEVKKEARYIYADGLEIGRQCIKEALEEVQSLVNKAISEGRRCMQNVH